MIDKYGTIYVDNSTLKAVAACPTQALAKYGFGLASAGERIAADCGTAIHEALALWIVGEDDSVVLEKLESLWREPSERLIPDDPKNYNFARRWPNLKIIIEEWLIQHPYDNMAWEPPSLGMVEVAFQVPLGSGTVDGSDAPRFVFCGRLDAGVHARHDGGLYVVDHKTTGRLDADFVEKWRNDSQMSGYPWGLGKTFGQPVTGVLINAIGIKKVPNSDRKCDKHGVLYAECGRFHLNSDLIIYQRTPAQLVEWERNALELAERWRSMYLPVLDIDPLDGTRVAEALRAVPTTGTFNGSCRYCDLRDFCPADKPAMYLGSMLVHRPWQPFELAKELQR